MKNFLFLVFLLVVVLFFYFKLQIEGDPLSKFNQTTRYSLGANGFWRNVFGLHNAGDAKKEFFGSQEPVLVEWFKPVDLEVDTAIIQKFAFKVGEVLGRPGQQIFGGGISGGTVNLSDLGSFQLKARAQKTNATSIVLVFLVNDYSPRPTGEFATNYNESGVVVSISGLKQYLAGYPLQEKNYLYDSMLQQFGRQVGLSFGRSGEDCIMSPYSDNYTGSVPPIDFCQAEKDKLDTIKLQYSGASN